MTQSERRVVRNSAVVKRYRIMTPAKERVVRAAMRWFFWEKRIRVTALIWPKEIELSKACAALSRKRGGK